MNAENKNLNPYPGPRPFEPEESGIFFGRQREVRELRSLITAHRAVLLYAQSGAGKTSLLNAGLIPLLSGQGFEVLPVARVRGFEPEDMDLNEIPNIYVFNTLMVWAGENVGPASLVSTSIGTFLKEREHLTDEQGLPLPTVAVFDQFEELFTSYPGRWEQREDFFRQVAEALDADPLLRVLFVIREDYLASLDSYVHFLPERLRTRYRLERLRAEAACQAVEGPLRDTGRTFAEGVPLSLVNKLLNIRVENAAGEIVETPGQYVEPVQLQIVCRRLWRNLPKEVTVITSDHLQEFGDVQEALRSFYERAIETAKRQTRARESDLRRWFNDKLITPAGTRGTVFQGKEQTEGIANSAVDALEAQHIIRAERRAGARWYELTHDRLIEPIRRSNAEAQVRRFRSLILRAALIAIFTLTFIVIIWIKYFKTYRLTVEAGHGDVKVIADDGSVVKDSMPASFRRGAELTLEAVPYPNYVFYRWSGALSEISNPAKLVMDEDKQVTASFSLKTYSLAVSSVAGGSVMIDPNKANYHHGETVTLRAVPTMGYLFTYWSGDLSGSTNPVTLVMDTRKSVTASFAPKTYTLAATAVNGEATKSPDKTSYNHGETVVLEAIPNNGYSFTDWSGDLKISANPATLVMDGNKSVTAIFALVADHLNRYILKTAAVDGSVTKNPDKASYNHGETVVLEAIPNKGYSFKDWSDALSGDTNPTTLVMDDNKSVTANFAALKAGDLVTNSIGMKLVYIPPGSFMMGSSSSAEQLAREYRRKKEQFTNEFPQHQVRITEGFWMGQTEVTKGQYFLVMKGKSPSVTDSQKPAVDVTWYDAVTFCRRLSQQEGNTYRLPTEAEWEYACRADTTTQFSFGDSYSSLGDYAWFEGNAFLVGQRYAHPVRQKKPNPWGLYDMNGNVWEWCSDYYGEDYYSKSPSVNPMGPPTGTYRCLRGGSFYSHVSRLRCSHREHRLAAPKLGSSEPSGLFGFRIVRQPKTTYNLRATAIDGSVTKKPDQAGYNHGQMVVLEAVPNMGYGFKNWSGDLSGSTNPTVLVMDSDKSVTAKCAKTYSLTDTAVDGSVTKNPDKASYIDGETVLLAAVPDPNYSFVGWSGDLSGRTNPTTLVMDSDKSVTASFVIKAGTVITNSIDMKMVYIPAGSFMMSSPSNEKDRFRDEEPQHKVKISKGFWMGQTEVTQDRYKSVMNAQPWSGKDDVQESPDNPVVYVSWEDAVEFCRRLGQQEGKTYRLPTEAEWEYACRAGTKTRFSFGDSETSLGDYAWYRGNTYEKGQKYAHPVGQKKRNPWGLYDMHGNVREWCNDWYGKDYYSDSPPIDPKGPSSGKYRIIRGGSWYNTASYLRCADRYGCVPDFRHRSIGFRVVRSQ